MTITPTHPIENVRPGVTTHIGDGRWATRCGFDYCDELLEADSTGGVNSARSRHVTMLHNVADDEAQHRTVGGMTTGQLACGRPVSDDGLNTSRDITRVTCSVCLRWRGFGLPLAPTGYDTMRFLRAGIGSSVIYTGLTLREILATGTGVTLVYETEDGRRLSDYLDQRP